MFYFLPVSHRMPAVVEEEAVDGRPHVQEKGGARNVTEGAMQVHTRLADRRHLQEGEQHPEEAVEGVEAEGAVDPRVLPLASVQKHSVTVRGGPTRFYSQN